MKNSFHSLPRSSLICRIVNGHSGWMTANNAEVLTLPGGVVREVILPSRPLPSPLFIHVFNREDLI